MRRRVHREQEDAEGVVACLIVSSSIMKRCPGIHTPFKDAAAMLLDEAVYESHLKAAPRVLTSKQKGGYLAIIYHAQLQLCSCSSRYPIQAEFANSACCVRAPFQTWPICTR